MELLTNRGFRYQLDDSQGTLLVDGTIAGKASTSAPVTSSKPTTSSKPGAKEEKSNNLFYVVAAALYRSTVRTGVNAHGLNLTVNAEYAQVLKNAKKGRVSPPTQAKNGNNQHNGVGNELALLVPPGTEVPIPKLSNVGVASIKIPAGTPTEHDASSQSG
ncbi:hypothetical protein BASA81_006402 [Batrachochytrium salamandrivorans]|nr:hypothetical protein BASA81_006402 [Batrachochytrium salamandrivorans]